MNPIIKEHVISAINTFITTFVTVVGMTLADGGIAWTGAFWLSVFLTAGRAAVKELIARYLPAKLGGRK